MNTFTNFAISLLACIVLLYIAMKRFSLNNLQKALDKCDYETVAKVADMKMTRRLLKDYVCDIYKLRAFYLDKDVENFDVLLEIMIANKDYKDEDKKELLITYYHTFLLKGNKKYVDILLQGIKNTNDLPFVSYNQYAYEVMINKRSDLIETMDNEINSKKYYGFPLGVIVYMIAMQYIYLDDKERALTYFQNALVCFHPKSIYVPKVNEYIENLTQEMEIDKHNIDDELTTYD